MSVWIVEAGLIGRRRGRHAAIPPIAAAYTQPSTSGDHGSMPCCFMCDGSGRDRRCADIFVCMSVGICVDICRCSWSRPHGVSRQKEKK